MVVYDRGVLHFNKGWSVVSVQNNCSSNPSSRQNILTRAQLKLDECACFPNRCMLPPQEKQWIQIMDAQSLF